MTGYTVISVYAMHFSVWLQWSTFTGRHFVYEAIVLLPEITPSHWAMFISMATAVRVGVEAGLCAKHNAGRGLAQLWSYIQPQLLTPSTAHCADKKRKGVWSKKSENCLSPPAVAWRWHTDIKSRTVTFCCAVAALLVFSSDQEHFCEVSLWDPRGLHPSGLADHLKKNKKKHCVSLCQRSSTLANLNLSDCSLLLTFDQYLLTKNVTNEKLVTDIRESW